MLLAGTLALRGFVIRFVRVSTVLALLALPVWVCGQAGGAVAPGPAQAANVEPVSDGVEQAEAAIAAKDWETAAGKLDLWLTAHPEDGRALFDAGYVADVENRTSDAKGLYRRAVAADGKAFEAHLLLGLLLAREGKTDEARTVLKKTTTLDAGEDGAELKGRAWRALARLDSSTDATAASSDLLEALKLTPETVDDMLLAAEIAERAGQTAAAEAEYRRAVAKDPKSGEASAALAHLLIKGKKYAEAEPLLRTALESAPGDPALTAQLAAVLAAEDKAEALPLLQKLNAEHPEDAAISRMLAEVLADAGDFETSDQLYVKLLSTASDDLALLVGHGQNLVRLGKYPAAFAAFDKATKLDPANVDGWSGLAFAASRSGQPAVTIKALGMRGKYLPENPSSLFLWATAYDSLHQTVQAVAYYHRFLTLAAGKYATEEWQARERLKAIEK